MSLNILSQMTLDSYWVLERIIPSACCRDTSPEHMGRVDTWEGRHEQIMRVKCSECLALSKCSILVSCYSYYCKLSISALQKMSLTECRSQKQLPDHHLKSPAWMTRQNILQKALFMSREGFYSALIISRVLLKILSYNVDSIHLSLAKSNIMR